PPYYHTVHTYVHSFPTRRSSDLTTVKTCFCLDIEAGIERCGSGPAVAPRGDVAPEIKVSNISICPIDQHNRRMANLEVQVFDKADSFEQLHPLLISTCCLVGPGDRNG